MKFPLFKLIPLFALGVCFAPALLPAADEGSKVTPPSSDLVTRAYRSSSSFESALNRTWYEKQTVDKNADPFADPIPGAPNTLDFVTYLKSVLVDTYGITFPEGTFIKHDPESEKLEIRHNAESIDLIEYFLTNYDSHPAQQVNIRVEIYQMPAKAALRVQQLSGPLDDHTSIWKKVQIMLGKGQATLAATAFVTTRSGSRADTEEASEVIYPTDLDWNDKQERGVPTAFEVRNVGTRLEVDPVITADGFTIELSLALSHHTALPTMEPIKVTAPNGERVVVTELPRFHSKRIITQLVMGNGSTKCIAAWRPTGKPEYEKENLMQVVFLRADIQVIRGVTRWED